MTAGTAGPAGPPEEPQLPPGWSLPPVPPPPSGPPPGGWTPGGPWWPGGPGPVAPSGSAPPGGWWGWGPPAPLPPESQQRAGWPRPVRADRSGGEEPPPRTVRDAVSWLLLAAGGFLVGQLASALLVLAVAAAVGQLQRIDSLVSAATPPGWLTVSELVGLWIGFVGAALLASKRRGSGSVVRDLGLSLRWVDLPVGVVVGLLGQFVLLGLLYLPFEYLDPNLSNELSQPAEHLTAGFPGAQLAVIAALTVLVVPVVEELLFRGVVLRAFVRLFRPVGGWLGPVLSVTATGLVFGLAHFELLQLAGLVAFGIVLSVLAYRTKRLGPGIVAHATFNLTAVLAVAASAH